MRLPRSWRPPSVARGPGPAAGVALVAVPGLGLSVQGWRACLTLLGRQAGAVAVALPAFGLPAPRGLALDPVASAERLVDRLDGLVTGPVVLAGHSASCQVVAEVARRAPDRVAGLVLVGPSTDRRAATWPRLAGRWLRNAAHEPVAQVPLLARDYSYSGLVSFARAMDAARAHPLDEVLPACPVPVLLVRGSLDRIAPQSWLDHLAARSAEAGTATVAGAAHMVPVTHPWELAAALRPFVERTTPRRW
jgi:pimeloyl-ACP methyl ester carboxylesterase